MSTVEKRAISLPAKGFFLNMSLKKKAKNNGEAGGTVKNRTVC